MQQTLPEGYRFLRAIDLQNDKKTALLVNVAALVIAVIMVVPAAFLVPFFDLSVLEERPFFLLIECGVLLIGMVLYILLHELVHGVFMKRFSGIKPRYGFTGLYAYAGSDAFFSKTPYLIIAFAPIVLLGVFLLVLNFLVPSDWFWAVYLLQVINVSGAAGDLYVSLLLAKTPKDILVKDVGTAMAVFTKE